MLTKVSIQRAAPVMTDKPSFDVGFQLEALRVWILTFVRMTADNPTGGISSRHADESQD